MCEAEDFLRAQRDVDEIFRPDVGFESVQGDQNQLQVLAGPRDTLESLDLPLEFAPISLVDAEALGVVLDLAERDDLIVAVE